VRKGRGALPTPEGLPPDLAGKRCIGSREIRELLGLGRATFERMLAAGKLPEPIRLSRTCHRWRLEVVLAWIEAGCPAVQPATRVKKTSR
jgi:predicted DNA-binding transcriptional regulator AlpA